MTGPRPNFFIVGAPRCGTTAMYEFLRQHPDVFMPYRKEPVYFGADLHKRPPYLDESGYLKLFAGSHGERRLGEATVWYLYSKTAPHEIKAFAPDARIIIMLRNPVDMIHSLHQLWLSTANEDITDFEEALAAEDDRRQGRRLPAHVRRPEGLQYHALGRYTEHVERWLGVFGRDAVKNIIFDDFKADPAGVYREAAEFLGVDPTFQPDFAIVNANKGFRSERLRRITSSGRFVASASRLPGPAAHALRRALTRVNMRPRARTSLSPELRRRLTREFAADIERLAHLLGRDLGAWTATGAAVDA
jgi:Sulfotransferase domain